MNMWNYIIVWKLFVLIVTRIYNCLQTIIIVNYLKAYNCMQIICIR